MEEALDLSFDRLLMMMMMMMSVNGAIRCALLLLITIPAQNIKLTQLYDSTLYTKYTSMHHYG